MLNWNYTGKAVHGYKLVYSKSNTSPAFGNSEAIHFSDMNEMSGSLPSKDSIGSGKYYVRVCAFTADTLADACVDYSNIVILNL